jgi:ATP-dependent exoDNAse (exonuclease V) beta subunit
LKFLNSPIDNIAFASFITGDIFSKASGLDAQSLRDFIFKLQHKNERSAYLYREFRLGFPDVWDKLIEEFFKNVGFVPLYELVVSILGKFNALMNFSSYQGFFMRLLELIKEQEEERPSIASFLEFFDTAADKDLYVSVTESDSIKILTIHKSKGLEFPVVIIPFLEMDVKIDSEVVTYNDSDLGLLYIKKRYADFSPRLAEIYKKEYLKSFIDELNSVYVAFTRAEDELYIFVSPKSEKGFNLASLLLPKDNLERGRKMGYKKDNGRKEVPTIEIIPSEYKDWIHLLKDEFIDENTLQAREKILKGEILHCILSFVGNLHNQDKERLLRQALEKTKARFHFMRNFEEFKLTIDKLLDSKQLKGFFEVVDGEVYLEKEIVDSGGHTKRIDRLIVKQKEAWIIDYKSNKENKSIYYDQVIEYMKIIHDIYPDSKVKSILIYLDDLSTEEVYAENNKP